MMKSLICFILVASSGWAAEKINDEVTTSIRSRNTNGAVSYLRRNPRNINKKNKLGMTPVMVAVSEKHLESLNEILRFKPDLSIRGFENKTALEIGMEEPVPAILEALLAAGAKVDAQDPETGSTVLHSAVRAQNLEVIRLLLKYKADVNIKNKKGDSPLSLSASRQMQKVYALLVASLNPAK